MKVKDLLDTINIWKKEYDDFLEYDVYTEQCGANDKSHKRNDQRWDIVADSEQWEYFKCEGFHTILKDKKIFTVNVNY